MVLATAASTVGLLALLALPGAHHALGEPVGAEKEVMPGADALHVSLEPRSDEERPGPGDRVRYTVTVYNSGAKAVPEAEIVHFLPPTMRYVSGPTGAEAGERRVTWSRPLEAGERATARITGEITGVREGGLHPVATVCARSAPGAVLVSCDSVVQRVHAVVPPVWVVTGLAFAASVALCVGGLVRHRHMGEPGGEPAPVDERPIAHAPRPETAPVPDGATEPVPVPERSAEPVPVPERSAEPVSVSERSAEPTPVPERSAEPVSVPEGSAEPAHEPETVSASGVIPVPAARAAEFDAHS